jgi:hypothetical protein
LAEGIVQGSDGFGYRSPARIFSIGVAILVTASIAAEEKITIALADAHHA